ncbi:hypothetical protein MC28_2227 [Bacillus thuringiensis MC28]|nr:hypothetical protein MC28_2227 [Bacillus thuringiensis MC28]
MKGTKKEIHIDDKVIRYTHIEKGSNIICFMFSGSGYNYDKPLFYYATMLMLEHKIDVVHIHYSYDGQYNDSMFLGKSLGTIPIANDLMKREEFSQSKMILLTPLLTFNSIFDSILHSRHEGLLVIGDRDHQYNADQIEQLDHSNLKIEIVNNANHSLHVGEYKTENSIEAIAKVIETLKEVVRTN